MTEKISHRSDWTKWNFSDLSIWGEVVWEFECWCGTLLLLPLMEGMEGRGEAWTGAHWDWFFLWFFCFWFLMEGMEGMERGREAWIGAHWDWSTSHFLNLPLEPYFPNISPSTWQIFTQDLFLHFLNLPLEPYAPNIFPLPQTNFYSGFLWLFFVVFFQSRFPIFLNITLEPYSYCYGFFKVILFQFNDFNEPENTSGGTAEAGHLELISSKGSFIRELFIRELFIREFFIRELFSSKGSVIRELPQNQMIQGHRN